MEGKLWAPCVLGILTLPAHISLAVNTDDHLEQWALLLGKGGGMPDIFQPESTGTNDQECVGRVQK